TAASIRQQTDVLNQQERSYRVAKNSLRKLEKLQQAPYFARIDFVESGSSSAEQLYIGIGSFVDEETFDLLVCDWRAPISGMFYDYTPGPAQYETPDGLVTGEMTLKRQYIIKNGKLDNMFDTGVNIGDEMLQHILAKNVHDKMSSIVTTIQHEQNQIIRDDKHDILIVQGAAGGGKTSVALQRVAYLLYKYRKTLTTENMVLFSPNSLFNDYVSNVLPELGETNMQQTTFQAHIERNFEGHFKVEDAYDQLEYLLTAEESDLAYKARVRGIEWKTSPPFLALLNRYVEMMKTEGVLFHSFTSREETVISKERLLDLFYKRYGDLNSISGRIDKIKEWVLEDLRRAEERMFHEELRLLRASPRYMGTDDEMKNEARHMARRKYGWMNTMAERLDFVDAMGMYTRLFTDRELIEKLGAGAFLQDGFEEIGRYTLAKLEADEIPYEDATPILYLKAAFEGMNSFRAIRQVIIDEAQDYSPFQLEYMRRMFPRARFTMLGDLNQGIYHANVQSYEMIGDLFGEDVEVGVVRLTKSYRSTGEIVDFTRRILLNPEPIEAIQRSGEPPQVIAVEAEEQLAAEIARGIAALQEQGMESIAVICKTAQETAMAHEALKGLVQGELHLLTQKTRTFVSGLVVVPVYLAKGLEFDAVIVYNAGRDSYHRQDERKLLYTACTRALHHLYVYYTGALTPFLAGE
ncbi:MAG: RNA polymerase recycling motor HelD, partial [Tumebacillaceae bacterium]